MKKYVIVYGLIGILFCTFAFSWAHAFFTSSAMNTNNTFTAAAVFPTGEQLITPTATPTPTLTITPTPIPLHIVINEIDPNGTGVNEWVELFNPTASPIDVSGWIITDNTSSDTLPSVLPIPAGGFAVIVASGSAVVVPGSAIKIELTSLTIGNALAVAGDRLILKNTSSTIIDQMSWGTDTTIFSGPGAPSSIQSLSRNPNGLDSDSGTDWAIGAKTLGVTN